MKKFLILLLIASAIFSSCASSDGQETIDSSGDPDTVETTPETEAETGFKQSSEYFEYVELELASDPVYQDGKFLLYFTSDKVYFDESTEFLIGVRMPGEAYTILATSETDQHTDMTTEYAYRGIALRPSKEIPAGTYTFSVTFEYYICEFEFTIQ